MRIAVTASKPALDAALDPRFGRCAYFIILDTEDMSFEAVDNSEIASGGGAGIQSAQLVAEKGVKAVLTGNCGPNAHRSLCAAGIEVLLGLDGSVLQAVERFKSGELRASSSPNAKSHAGMGS